MTTIDVAHEIDASRVEEAVQQAIARLTAGDSDVVLDLAGVERVTPSELKRLEEVASQAEKKSVKPVLRGVSVHIYKVLKLASLTSRYRIVN